MRRLVLLFSFFLHFSVAKAQQVWNVPTAAGILSKQVSVDGNLLLLRSTGLTCLDKTKGEELWKISFTNAASMVALPNSPVVSIKQPSDGTELTTLVNSLTGKVIYDPVKEGHGENKVYFINNSDKVINWAVKGNSTEVYFYNKVTGNLENKAQVSEEVERIEKVERLSDNQLLVFATNSLTCINTAAKKVVFNTPLKTSEKVTTLPEYYKPTFNIIPDSSNIYSFIRKGYLTLLDITSGKIIAETNLESAFATYHVVNKNHLLLGVAEGKNLKLNLIDKTTGNSIRKGVVPISNVSSLLVDGNNLYVLSTNAISGSSVKLVDYATFTLKENKTFKTAGIYYSALFKSENGIALDGPDIKYFNPTTYEKINASKYYYSQNTNQLPFGDETYYLTSAGSLGKFNKNKGIDELLSEEKINLKLAEGEKAQMQYANDGFLVLTSQSISKINLKGNIQYSHYFAPPGPSFGSVVGNTLLLAASAYLATDAQLMAGSTTNSYLKQSYLSDQKMYQSLGSEFGQNISKRFSASVEANNYLIFLTKADRAEEGRFKLVKVNKNTGNVDGQVEVVNRTPDYLFDPFENKIYLFSENEIKAYSI